MDFAPLSKAGGVDERLANVLGFQIGKVSKEIGCGTSGCNCLYDHPHGYTHAADASLATHYIRIERDAPQLLHASMIAQ